MGFSYRQAIGELIFALTICQPDIAVPVIKLLQYALRPAPDHYKAVKANFANTWISSWDEDDRNTRELSHRSLQSMFFLLLTIFVSSAMRT
jgi:hypothetical protein